MYALKGFLVIQSLADNNPGVIAPIGELSTYAKTYTQDMGFYTRVSPPDLDLYTFSSKENDSTVLVPDSVVETALMVGQSIYDYARANGFTDDPAHTSTIVLGLHDQDIQDLYVGTMVEISSGLWMPEWIEYSDLSVPGSEIKLWLSDGAFRSQYDEYNIIVIPPVDNIDDLIGVASQVQHALNQINDSQRMFRIQQAKNYNPETISVTEMFRWRHPLEPENTISTAWTCVIYGQAGNNIDSIRNALKQYILDNSQIDAETWETYFPEIFNITEFTIVPLWGNMAIPNETVQAGVFSPTIAYSDILSIADTATPSYPVEHIEQVLSISGSSYRSLPFITMGGPDNLDGILRLTDTFDDYIVVPSTSPDFGRMSPNTQSFVNMLTQMLIMANEMTDFNQLPLGMSRLYRDNAMYLVSSFGGIQYIVLSKQSYYEIFGDPDSNL